MIPAVSERWGFGMSPPKPAVHKTRRDASECTLRVLEPRSTVPNADPLVMESLSVVKGLFNRIVREDQWDWFTVAGQLGYPSRRISRVIAQELSHLRTAIKLGHETKYETTKTNLRRLPTRRCLSVLLGTAKIADEPGAGWIYILSTRNAEPLESWDDDSFSRGTGQGDQRCNRRSDTVWRTAMLEGVRPFSRGKAGPRRPEGASAATGPRVLSSVIQLRR